MMSGGRQSQLTIAGLLVDFLGVGSFHYKFHVAVVVDAVSMGGGFGDVEYTEHIIAYVLTVLVGAFEGRPHGVAYGVES